MAFVLKFSCPKCSSKMEIQKTFDKRMHVSCSGCRIEDILGFSRNIDEVFLEFLSRYDRGLVHEGGLQDGLSDEGIVRMESEIKDMIKGNNPDRITEEVLYSKKDYIAQYKVLSNPEPKMGCMVEDLGLDEAITDHLTKRGIIQLYSFQEEAALEMALGENIVIEAPTASGKTEAFLVPTVQRIKNKGAKEGIFAIFVYPTKALARDQYPKISSIAKSAGVRAGVFDGDTDSAERSQIKDHPPHILVTNFDVLHYHMWHQTALALLLSSAQMLIVDEAHVYSGIFGTNVHYIIKRLKRICTKKLQFVAASATLDDAAEFCQNLFGEKMTAIRGSGKRGRTDFVMLFPSLRTQRALMVDLTKRLTRNGHKTMVFNNSHLNSELLAIQAKKQGVNIKVHRAGLMARYRTSVERRFKEGSLDAISCTPTLELGIDVGNVDGVISSAVPVNRLIQRIGRAARKGQRGYAFLALGDDPISQYYRNHPDDYFEDVEKIYIDPKNPFIEEYQILAMAYDKPISMHELVEHKNAIRSHITQGTLTESDGRLVPNPNKAGPMLSAYSIRGIGNSVDIFLAGKKVGDRVLPIALEELHQNAIYFLAGIRYRVRKLDYPKNYRAELESIPKDYPYYTRALTSELPTIETIYEQRRAHGVKLAFCKLHIEKSVYGYSNIELGQDSRNGEEILLDAPLEYDFVTKGVVFHAPRPLITIESEDGESAEASGYHAAEHALIEGSNMITGGVSQDLGGISMGESGMIFVYDGAIGGSGASKVLYDRFEKVLARSQSIVSECPCRNEAGCPRCTFSYRCGNNNHHLHKRSASEILQRISSGERTDLSEIDMPI